MVQSSVDDVVDAVLTASRAFVSMATRSLAGAPADLTLPQYRALVVLASRGPQRPTELAADLAVAASTVTRLCDRLVRKELVSRSASPENRREVEVRLTARGRRLVDRVTAARRAEIERLVALLPAARRRAIASALNDLAAALGEVPEHAWPASARP